MKEVIQPTNAFPFVTLAFVDLAKPVDIIQALEANGCKYGLGAKAEPLSIEPSSIFAIDCSGCVRYMLYHSLGSPVDFDIPDGSVNQHGWLRDANFKVSDYAGGFAKDGAWRAAVLSPDDTSEGIGHILLIHNGQTYESHGSTGPASRAWGSESFMEQMDVYVLTAPEVAA